MGKRAAAVAGPKDPLGVADGEAAPVRVVGDRQNRLRVVAGGADGAGDSGMGAVRADHHSGVFVDTGPRRPVPADADHFVVVHQQFVDDEALTYLRSGLYGSVEEQLVENGSPGAVADADTISRVRGPLDDEWSEVERIGRDRRASGGDESVAQPPTLERSDSGRVNKVRGYGVGGEVSPVDDQYPVGHAGQQHRGR